MLTANVTLPFRVYFSVPCPSFSVRDSDADWLHFLCIFHHIKHYTISGNRLVIARQNISKLDLSYHLPRNCFLSVLPSSASYLHGIQLLDSELHSLFSSPEMNKAIRISDWILSIAAHSPVVPYLIISCFWSCSLGNACKDKEILLNQICLAMCLTMYLKSGWKWHIASRPYSRCSGLTTVTFAAGLIS